MTNQAFYNDIRSFRKRMIYLAVFYNAEAQQFVLDNLADMLG